MLLLCYNLFMKVAIISDIHDNLSNLDKVLNYLKNNCISHLICCGDVGTEKTLKYLINNFKGKLWCVFGNTDKDHVDYEKIKNKFKEVGLFKKLGKFIVANKTILIVHEPQQYQEYLEDKSINYVFYGHTHKPWQEIKHNKVILNPGNVTNQRYVPSFAIWDVDSGKFELVQINQLK